MLTLSSASCGTSAMCYGIQLSCTAANVASGICPAYLSGCTIFNGGCWVANATLGGGAAAQCTVASAGAAVMVSTGVVACATNGCNTAAAAAVKSASTVATPAFAVLALIASIAATAM